MYDRKSSERAWRWPGRTCNVNMTTPTHTQSESEREGVKGRERGVVAGNVLARLNGSIVLISLSWRFVCPSQRRVACSSCSYPCGYLWLSFAFNLLPLPSLSLAPQQRVPYVFCFGQCGSNFDTFKRRRRVAAAAAAPPLRFVAACMPSRHYFAQSPARLPLLPALRPLPPSHV